MAVGEAEDVPKTRRPPKDALFCPEVDRTRDTIESEPPVLEVATYGTVDEQGQFLEHAAVVPQPPRTGAEAVASIVVDVPVVPGHPSAAGLASSERARRAESTLPPRGHGGFTLVGRFVHYAEQNRGPLLMLAVGLLAIMVVLLLVRLAG